jgi:hypothetical protein
MVLFGTFCIPFLIVWISVLMTAFTVNFREVFESPIFWGITVIYWIIWFCFIGYLVEDIE